MPTSDKAPLKGGPVGYVNRHKFFWAAVVSLERMKLQSSDLDDGPVQIHPVSLTPCFTWPTDPHNHSLHISSWCDYPLPNYSMFTGDMLCDLDLQHFDLVQLSCIASHIIDPSTYLFLSYELWCRLLVYYGAVVHVPCHVTYSKSLTPICLLTLQLILLCDRT